MRCYYDFVCEELDNIRRTEPSRDGVFSSAFTLFAVVVRKKRSGEINQKEYEDSVNRLAWFHHGVVSGRIKLLNIRKYKRYRVTERDLVRNGEENAESSVFFCKDALGSTGDSCYHTTLSISNPAEVSAKQV